VFVKGPFLQKEFLKRKPNIQFQCFLKILSNSQTAYFYLHDSEFLSPMDFSDVFYVVLWCF